MNKKYLVCYFYWIENQSSGYGNAVITEGPDEDIYTEDEIRTIERHIIETDGFSGCCIQNIIPLNN